MGKVTRIAEAPVEGDGIAEVYSNNANWMLHQDGLLIEFLHLSVLGRVELTPESIKRESVPIARIQLPFSVAVELQKYLNAELPKVAAARLEQAKLLL